ncbi:MAG: DUF885 family protein [Proteobacteria bacterium]|nr:DUF885 family protein [Pseudomonadota bacterium]NIS71715.1 DUF885 family protein [Pseudomonadota bacterium]
MMMEHRKKRENPLNHIAKDYFDYLGRHLPQQCASDEFYFLPRSQIAIEFPNRLDDLTPEGVQEHIQSVKHLLGRISEARDELEEEIDRLLLRQSMAGFIREFDDARGWRNDPTLYIKIPLFATDRVLSHDHDPTDQVRSHLSSILSQVSSFLTIAIQNLRDPSEISIQVAVDMVQDAMDFYRLNVPTFIEQKLGGDKEVLAGIGKVLEAWERFREDLVRLSSKKSFTIGEDGLEGILAISWGYARPPREVLEIAQQAYVETQEKIRRFAKKIDSRKNWRRIIYEQPPSIDSPVEVMGLYQREVFNLRQFFYSRDVMSFPSGERVAVLETPSYLESLRATASYRAPLTGNAKAQGVFYITPGKEDLEIIAAHCPYLCAHETYPGHHILDHIRIHHTNPIRRQIESPLFYEGWATYAEQLLDELGYIQDPRQKLVQLKRQLWRNLRAILDVELHTGKIGLDDAAERIHGLGFSSTRAQRQVRRFALTPGYQLCYLMGSHEITRLRKEFSSRLGSRLFHDILLGGGEIPFERVRKRLEACLAKGVPHESPQT